MLFCEKWTMKYQQHSVLYYIRVYGLSHAIKHWKADRERAKDLINEDRKKYVFEAQYDHHSWM